MQSKAEDYDAVAEGLYQIISIMQDVADVPYSTLSSVCEQHEISVWVNALRLILTQSSPRIIPAEVGSDLVGKIPRLNGATSVNEVCHILGPLLDKLPRSHFATLGEFCAMVRDTSTSITLLACLVGPQLLMPNLLLNSEANQGPGALAAAAVMELLIIEAESLFGRCASQRITYPFGEFNHKNVRQVSGAIDFVAAASDPGNTVVKRALRAFYDWRDPIRSTGVDFLFSKLPMYRIAQGIQDKYGLIPPGWGLVLQALLTRGTNGMALPPSQNQAHGGMLSQNVKAELDRMASDQPTQTGYQESEAVGFVINEICESEKKYFSILNAFIETYCERLEAVAEGKEGEAQRACLGLSPADVETMFGRKLKTVRNASNNLVARLDVITSFAGVQDDGRGRLGLLVDAFNKVFKDLDALGPYMVTYKHVIKLIAERTEELKKGRKRGRSKRNKKGVNFIELWELERVKHDYLKLSSIENVLIKPIQRIPHYKIFFKELMKKTKDGHPAHHDVEQVLANVDNLGKKIDEQMHSDKATKILGI